MGEFGTINGQRDVPMDDDALADMLSRRPGEAAEIEREIPVPPPRPKIERAPQLQQRPIRPPQPKAPEPPPPPEPEETEARAPVEGEGPNDEMKLQMLLPDERTRDKLRQMYGELKVVPIPYMKVDGKYKCYILKTLMRSEWRAAEEAANKVKESKPNVSLQDILEEKIVSRAVVWPNLPEHEMFQLPAGLVSTLFGITQQMACFFNPEAVMQLTFSL